MSWVRRIAVEPRVCDDDGCLIEEGETYYLSVTGERFCTRHGPPDDMWCPL